MLATSSNEIRLWDTENFNLLNEYQFSKQVNWFCVRPDNSHIAGIVNKESLNIINLDNQNITSFTDVNEAKCCTYDSFGRYLGVGCLNGSIDMFDFKSNVKKKSYKISNSGINCISWSKNDRYIVTGHVNASIVILNTVTNTLSSPLVLQHKTQQAMCTAIQFSQQATNNFAAAYDDGTVVLWDSTKDKPLCTFKHHTSACTCVTLSPLNNMLMVSGGLDNLIACYDTSVKKCIKSIFVSGGVVSVDLHKNGSTLAVGSASGSVHMFDLRSKTDESFYSFNAHNSTLHGLKFVYSTSTSVNTSNMSHQTSDTSLTSTRTIRMDDSNPASSSTMKKSSSTTFDDTIQLRAPFHSTSNMNGGGHDVDYPKSASVQQVQQQQQQSYQIYSPDVTITKPESTALSINTTAATTHGPNGFILHRAGNSQQINSLTPILNASSSTSGVVTSSVDTNKNQLAPQSKPFKSSDPIYGHKGKSALFSPLQNDSTQSIDTSNITVNRDSLLNPKDTSQLMANKKAANFKNDLIENLLTKNAYQKTPVRVPSQQQQQQALKNDSLTPGAANQLTFNDTMNNSGSAQAILPIQQLKEFMKDTIDDLRDDFMNENFRFKAEMFKELMELRKEMQESLRACSVNDALVAEIKRLREENKRLKKLF